jgi:hypothetical protein
VFGDYPARGRRYLLALVLLVLIGVVSLALVFALR